MSELVYAVHTITNLVSEVPRLWLDILPFRELAAEELAQLRKDAGHLVPEPAESPAVTAVPAVPVEASTVPEPVKEG
jgi:hypothetical protein